MQMSYPKLSLKKGWRGEFLRNILHETDPTIKSTVAY